MPLLNDPKFSPVSENNYKIPYPCIGGLNLKDLSFELEPSQSPNCLNMMYRNGQFSKRYGQSMHKDFGEDECYAVTFFQNHIITHNGSRIYKDSAIESTYPETVLAENVSRTKGIFVNFNRYLYYLQPPVIDSVSISASSSTIYNIVVDKEEYVRHYTVNKTFEFNGYHWKSNGKYITEPIGITYEGVPNAGDKITVTVNKQEGHFWQSDGNYFLEVDPYVPDLVINRKPDGSYSDVIESYNMIGSAFKNTFHGDGTSKDYYLTSKGNELENIVPTVWFDVEEDEKIVPQGNYTFDRTNGKVTFKTAPAQGVNNVIIKAYYSQEQTNEYRDKILKSKYSCAFGGTNNSTLFLAGGGESIYYYSEVFDATYFPEKNYASVGNNEEDITGFGLQYNVLIIFKPKEIYQLTYYVLTSENTSTDDIGQGAYESQIVNGSIGCDAPYTIQIINNRLTWFNSIYGVCTLVSTNIQNERNVVPLSRNIDRGNAEGVKGILEFNEDLDTLVSADFENKYFLVFPESGMAYVWDYRISPYSISSTKETDPKRLSWFLFDNFHVKQFLQVKKELIYISNIWFFRNRFFKLNYSFKDIDFKGLSANRIGIHAYYQTPYFMYDVADSLKTVRNMYVQCRGDVPTKIDVTYFTNDDPNGIKEPESIIVPSNLWNKFTYQLFEYGTINIANTFRRKCSIKKVQLMSVRFDNNVIDADMSIAYLGFDYKVVKKVK